MQNEKPSAVLVHEADKAFIVGIRNETHLSEKDLMTIVISSVIKNRASIVKQGQVIAETAQVQAEQTRKANYEKMKEIMRKARAEVREESEARKSRVHVFA